MKIIYRILLSIFFCLTFIIIGSAIFMVSAQEEIASASYIPGIDGIWEGKLKVPVAEFRIVFKISKNSDGTLTATMDSPDQGVADIPVEEGIFI